MKSMRYLVTAVILITATVALTPSIGKSDILVYDNNDQYLGILIEMEGGNDMSLFIASLGGILKYSDDYSYWCDDELRVVFQSGDCTGTPYSNDPNPLIFDFSSTPNEGFYKVDYNGKQTFTPGSYYSEIGPCDCQPNTGQWDSAEYYPYVQVQMPFTTPVARPLSFKVRTKTVVVPLPE